jgi:hypothetical protein
VTPDDNDDNYTTPLSHPKGTATERILIRDAILRGTGALLDISYGGDGTWCLAVDTTGTGNFVYIEGKGAAAVLRDLADVLEES